MRMDESHRGWAVASLGMLAISAAVYVFYAFRSPQGARGSSTVGLAFGMKAIAWSQNLTAEKAAEQGVERVEKDELFRRADILSVHLVLSDRSRGLVGAREIGLMKPSSILVNTSRGPICDTAAVIEALTASRVLSGFSCHSNGDIRSDRSR